MSNPKHNPIKFSEEISTRQFRVLEKTQKIKDKANFMIAQEKNDRRCKKLLPKKSSLTPRPSSGRHIELMRNISASHRFDLISAPSAQAEHSPDIFPVVNKKIHEIGVVDKRKNSKVANPKLEESRSMDNSPLKDVLDSLVRFEGESEDVDCKNTITVNPNVDLKLLFFDEQQPDWAK